MNKNIPAKKRLGGNFRRKEDSPLRRMFNILRAESRTKRKWKISWEFFKKITSQPCFYCGLPPSQKAYGQTGNSRREGLRQDYERFVYYNGLDRMDNELDYFESNVVPCCKICNFAKRNLSIEEFKKWITRLCIHQFGDCMISSLDEK